MSATGWRGDACECLLHADHGDREECLDECPNTGLKCSRPEGHDGPHAGCTPAEHPAMAWGDRGDAR